MEEKFFSVCFLTEFIMKGDMTMVLIRHSNGQPLRMCNINEVQQYFVELLDEFRKSVAKTSAAQIAAE